MPDLATACERLDLPDADLCLWREAGLVRDPDALLRRLLAECEWRQERVTVYGKSWPQPRLSAWYGDYGYSYSGIRLHPLPWTGLLRSLKSRVERLTGCEFNSVLLNYYRDGNDAMGLHSDDETELGARPAIASFSLGEARDLILKHRSRRDLGTLKLALPSGSLLLMQGETQRHWRHGINRSRRPLSARVNLTFRRILAVPRGAAGY